MYDLVPPNMKAQFNSIKIPNQSIKLSVVLIKKNSNKKDFSDYTYNKNVILKIDIEGDEYEVFKDIKKNSSKILFLILELHGVDKKIKKIQNFLKKLDLKIIHIHGNNYGGVDKNKNPKVIELSLLNSKKIKILNIHSNNKYPIINLDYKNLKRRNDIKIEFFE